MDALQTFDLQQHVSFLTNIHRNWLDLFITRLNCNNIKSIHMYLLLMDYLIMII